MADKVALDALPGLLDGLATEESLSSLYPQLTGRPLHGDVEGLANQVEQRKIDTDEVDGRFAEFVDSDVLFAGGLIQRDRLPAYVDDVREYATRNAFPATGVRDIIYVTLDTNEIYRWSGTTYVALASPELLTIATKEETLPLTEQKKAVAPQPLGDVFAMLGFEQTAPGEWELDGGYDPGGIKEVTFFGEVSAADLITGSALATLCGLTTGTNIAANSSAGWLKMGDPVDNKIKYLAKRPFRHSNSWTQLNAAGLIYGKEVTIKGKKFIVRAMTAGVGSVSVVDMNAEWDRLWYAVCTGRHPDYTGPIVANYTLSQLAFVGSSGTAVEASQVWAPESGGGTNRVTRGRPLTLRNLVGQGQVNIQLGWRPMLVEV